MRIFMTGATGYIGSVVTETLLAAGHRVAGLARSDEAARQLAKAGAEAVRGSLDDAGAIERGAAGADGAIHLAAAFTADGPMLDRAAVDAILRGLDGGGKPFVYTSGVWVVGSTGGHVVDETAPIHPVPLVAWRPEHEEIVRGAAGARGIVIRPAMVFGRGRGFVRSIFRPDQRGVVRYVGTGENRWSTVHVDDLAELYVRALDAAAGSLYFAASGPGRPRSRDRAGVRGWSAARSHAPRRGAPRYGPARGRSGARLHGDGAESDEGAGMGAVAAVAHGLTAGLRGAVQEDHQDADHGDRDADVGERAVYLDLLADRGYRIHHALPKGGRDEQKDNAKSARSKSSQHIGPELLWWRGPFVRESTRKLTADCYRARRNSAATSAGARCLPSTS